MPAPLVVLWWLWVGVSVVVWVRRLLRRTSRHRALVPMPTTAAAEPANTPRAPVAPTHVTEPARPARSIAHALAGISMPCDLAPLIRSEFGDDHVAFFTDGHDVGRVRDALTVALERLGMDTRALTDTIVVAKREDATVRVTLHAGPTSAIDVFPSLPVGRVVVELELLESQPSVP